MNRNKKIYCAGPLFNEPERAEMKSIADVLEKAGYDTFLPQRDGFELCSIVSELEDSGFEFETATKCMRKIIFYLDIYHLCYCDGTVANLNGRVPDEGTIVEASISWFMSKPTFLYKNDSRGFSKVDGYDNLMVQGIGNFKYINNIKNIAHVFNIYFENYFSIINYFQYTSEITEIVEIGRLIHLTKSRVNYKIGDLINIIYDNKIEV